jgi:hypothetical protein
MKHSELRGIIERLDKTRRYSLPALPVDHCVSVQQVL